jgi:hypothetical protein
MCMPDSPEPSSPRDLPTLDWSTFPLPSDRLTLGQLRSVASNDVGLIEVHMHNVITLEKEVAINEMVGAGEHDTESKRLHNVLVEGVREELVTLYVQLGLAGGEHEAKQLVEELLSTARSKVARPQSQGRS